jgi:hypothetical protein
VRQTTATFSKKKRKKNMAQQANLVPVTQDDAIKNFQAGIPCLIVEFRSSKAERITWRDKTTRETMTAPLLRHCVESANGTPYVVNERVDATFDPDAFKQTFVRGSKVFLEYVSSESMRGIIHFAGTIRPLAGKT